MTARIAAGAAAAAVLLTPTVGVAAAAPPTPLPLTARLIQPGGFPGLLSEPGQSTTYYTSPSKWAAIDKGLSSSLKDARTARFRREGFVALLARHLRAPTNKPWTGLSWVMQLGSTASARAELAANVREAAAAEPPIKYTPFTVTGIPDAHGYRFTGLEGVGENLVFADGPFVYLVGCGGELGQKGAPTRTELIAAAGRLYKRVHGHPAH